MSFLNQLLPWRRKRIAAVTAALVPPPPPKGFRRVIGGDDLDKIVMPALDKVFKDSYSRGDWRAIYGTTCQDQSSQTTLSETDT